MSSVKLMPTVGLSLQEVKRKNLSSRPVGPARIREDPPTRSGEANENAAPVGACTVLSATVNGKRKHSARWARAFKRRQAEGGEQSQDETGSSRRGSKAEMGTDAEKHLDSHRRKWAPMLKSIWTPIGGKGAPMLKSIWIPYGS